MSYFKLNQNNYRSIIPSIHNQEYYQNNYITDNLIDQYGAGPGFSKKKRQERKEKRRIKKLMKQMSKTDNNDEILSETESTLLPEIIYPKKSTFDLKDNEFFNSNANSEDSNPDDSDTYDSDSDNNLKKEKLNTNRRPIFDENFGTIPTFRPSSSQIGPVSSSQIGPVSNNRRSSSSSPRRWQPSSSQILPIPPELSQTTESTLEATLDSTLESSDDFFSSSNDYLQLGYSSNDSNSRSTATSRSRNSQNGSGIFEQLVDMRIKELRGMSNERFERFTIPMLNQIIYLIELGTYRPNKENLVNAIGILESAYERNFIEYDVYQSKKQILWKLAPSYGKPKMSKGSNIKSINAENKVMSLLFPNNSGSLVKRINLRGNVQNGGDIRNNILQRLNNYSDQYILNNYNANFNSNNDFITIFENGIRKPTQQNIDFLETILYVAFNRNLITLTQYEFNLNRIKNLQIYRTSIISGNGIDKKIYNPYNVPNYIYEQYYDNNDSKKELLYVVYQTCDIMRLSKDLSNERKYKLYYLIVMSITLLEKIYGVKINPETNKPWIVLINELQKYIPNMKGEGKKGMKNIYGIPHDTFKRHLNTYKNTDWRELMTELCMFYRSIINGNFNANDLREVLYEVLTIITILKYKGFAYDLRTGVLLDDMVNNIYNSNIHILGHNSA